jgi:hypothetical protein
MMGKFQDDKITPVHEPTPYDELFADCRTPEDVLELQRDIEAAEASGQAE